jgi:hypothetical protein
MPDALTAPAWAAVTALAILAGWVLSGRAFPGDGVLRRAGHTALGFWACVAAVATALGAAGALSSGALLAGVACVAALALWVAHTKTVAYRLLPKVDPPPPAPDEPPSRWDAVWLSLWTLWLTYAVGRVVVGGLLEFPTDFDTLMYHLPLIDQWLRAGSTYAPDDAVWYNPSNGELMGLWMVAPYSGDFLISLNNLPAVVLLGTSALELGQQLGLGRWLRNVAALAVVSNYAVTRQLLDAKNDVAAAALFFAAVAYGFRYLREQRPASLALCATALGMLAGVKYYAAAYAAVAWLGLAGTAWLARGPRAAGRVVLASLAGTCLLAGYWYARNAWVTGTPVYPKGFSAADDPLADIRPDLWQTTLLGNGRPEVFSLFVKAVGVMAGPYNVAAFLLLPATSAWLACSGLWLLGVGRAAASLRVGIGLMAPAAGVALGLTPFAVETTPDTMNMLLGAYLPVRFGLCFLGLTVVAMAVCAQDFGRGVGALAGRMSGRGPWPARAAAVLAAAPAVALTAGAVWQQWRMIAWRLPGDKVDSALVAVNLLLAGGVALACWHAWPRLRPVLACAAALALCAGAGLAADWLGRRWHAGFADHFDRQFGGAMFSRLADREPEKTHVCVIGYRYYPFFGSGRQFRASRPEYLPSYPRLLAYLWEHDATVVAAVHTDSVGTGRYQGRQEWLRENPQLFRLIQETPHYGLWEVDRERLEAAVRQAAPPAGAALTIGRGNAND